MSKTINNKKNTQRRDAIFLDEKYTGEEVEWTGKETPEEYHVKLRQHINYCNYYFSIKSLKNDIVNYCQKLDFLTKQELSKLRVLADNSKLKTNLTTIAALCHIACKNCNLHEHEQEFIKKVVREALFNNVKITSDAEDQEKSPNTAVAPSIQDRLNEKMAIILANFDGIFDEVYTTKKIIDTNTYSYLQENTVPLQLVGKIAKVYQDMKEELIAAQDGSDEQLQEGYSNLKPKDFKTLITWLDKLLNDLDSYGQSKKNQRAPRAKKAPSKAKLVQKVKYCKEFAELKITSVNPVTVLGASQAWVFNVKTRKVGFYIAEGGSTLSIKGTSIINYDEVKSVCKTVRKPEAVLKDFIKSAKTNCKKLFDGINAVDTKLTGRLSEDWLILKVF